MVAKYTRQILQWYFFINSELWLVGALAIRFHCLTDELNLPKIFS